MTQSEWILSVVSSFYEKAEVDILIGYHFRNIHNFTEHIPRIASFWELQLLGSTERKIDPPFDILNAHIPLGIKRGEIGRWILLFKLTLDEKTAFRPEFLELKNHWLKKLDFFQSVFLRFFST